MVRVEVKFDDAGLTAALEKLQGDLVATTEIHQAMALGVGETVRGHFLELNSRSQHTGFYGKASRSVETLWDAAAGTVRIPHRGTALRYYGGRVNMKDLHLALHTENVPVRGDERLRPGEIPDLAFLPRSKKASAGTFGYLVEGVEKQQKNGKTRLVPKPGGRLMFVLRDYTDHEEDPTVLPTQAELLAAATVAATDYLSAAIREGGLA